jgi:hypothetical protein
MTKSPERDVATTSKALDEEAVKGNWAKRLFDCRAEREDEVTHFDEGEREYHTRTLSRHYENGVQIAVSITYEYFAGNSRTTYLMLLIGGVRHMIQ